MRLPVILSLALAPALASCASGTRPTVTSNEPASPMWTGSLQPTQQRTGALAVTGQTRAFGSVKISPSSSGNPNRLRVSLTVSLPVSAPMSVGWAVVPDRCGSGNLPIMGFEQFPLIEVSTNGRGQLDTELPMTLSAGSSYHVNIYSGGQQLDNVVTCGNLKRDDVSSAR